MANPGGLLANLIKMMVTITCIRYLEDAYSIMILRSFQIFLVHSVLGIFRFGITGGLIGKRGFREFFERFSNIVEIVPFAMIATEISRSCDVDNILRQSMLLILSLLPIVHEIVPRKERTKIRVLINYAINLQLIIITIACLRKGSLNVINLVISYIFNRYYVETFCDNFDIPYDDLIQYSLCFIEIFSLTTLRQL